MYQAHGGGEVMLEVTIEATGAVVRMDALRATPPFTELLAASVRTWRFDPPTIVKDGGRTAVAGQVLVVGLFRPPTTYDGPAPGGHMQQLRGPSDDVPAPLSTVLPAYPPNAVGSVVVILEIALGPNAAPRGLRVLTAPSGFDGAAVAAVRQWRFAPPRAASGADPVYVYAVLGFRSPVASGAGRVASTP